ncbi:MAG TPA: cation:proton antiporter [Thermotogae bacterium]|nr:multicomponent Na+:H+ antiporter subunit [Thermotogota bacterium]HCZ07210.1 cation:proton antiporter [Thermotogota bacterium]
MSFFFIMLVLAVLLNVIRLVIGPTGGDRLAALDALNIVITGGMVVFALYTGRDFYIDVALIYGALAFVETIVMARYLEAKK